MLNEVFHHHGNFGFVVGRVVFFETLGQSSVGITNVFFITLGGIVLACYFIDNFLSYELFCI